MRALLKSSTSRWGAAILAVLCLSSTLPAENIKHLTQAQLMSSAVEKAAPAYSAVARQLKLEGTFEVNAFISEEGTVERVESVAGNPVLIRAASDALKHWKFRPIQEDGKAVKAVAGLTFTFKL